MMKQKSCFPKNVFCTPRNPKPGYGPANHPARPPNPLTPRAVCAPNLNLSLCVCKPLKTHEMRLTASSPLQIFLTSWKNVLGLVENYWI